LITLEYNSQYPEELALPRTNPVNSRYDFFVTILSPLMSCDWHTIGETGKNIFCVVIVTDKYDFSSLGKGKDEWTFK
jgi:hypothetical protein